MKVYLYMAATANGYISSSRSMKMISSASGWKRYCATVKSFGNIMIGRRTFEIMRKYGRIKDLGKSHIIVLTKKKIDGANQTSASSPKASLALLKRLGFKRALLAGGSRTNLSFIKEDLIDEIYLDVEPKLFGSGNGIFKASGIKRKLHLLGMKLQKDGVVQLHYALGKPAA